MALKPSTFSPAVVGLLLLAAAAVYIGCLDFVYFGRLDDDAVHWLAAVSLTQGRYVDLAHPALPPIGIPPPGYPILLLPAAWIGSTRLAQWMSIFFTLGGVAAALALLRRQPAAALAAAALTALNPVTVLQSTPLRTDAAFFVFSMASLAALARALAAPERGLRPALAAALLAVAATWIRTQGIALLAASTLVLLETAALRRLAWRYVAFAAPLAAAPQLWALARAERSSTYFAHLAMTSSRPDSAGLGLVSIVLDNLRFYAGAITTRTMLGWVAPLPGENSAAAWLLAALLLAALGWSCKKAFAEGGTPRLLVLYVVFYFGLHLVWSNQFRRYIFPMLPILYWLLLRQVESKPKLLWGATLPLLLLFAAFDGGLAWSSHVRRPNENVPPLGTLAWIHENTAPEDVLAGRYRGMFAALTHRYVLELVALPDPDEWFHTLTRHHVRFVVNHPEGETMETVRREQFKAQARLMVELLEDKSRFQPVHRSEGEPFIIYRLIDGERFERGYELLERGRHALLERGRHATQAGDLRAAHVEFEAARRTGAPIVRLPFYLGTTEMLLGRPKEARRWLEEAVRREPAFVPARLNLQRVLEISVPRKI